MKSVYENDLRKKYDLVKSTGLYKNYNDFLRTFIISGNINIIIAKHMRERNNASKNN